MTCKHCGSHHVTRTTVAQRTETKRTNWFYLVSMAIGLIWWYSYSNAFANFGAFLGATFVAAIAGIPISLMLMFISALIGNATSSKLTGVVATCEECGTMWNVTKK